MENSINYLDLIMGVAGFIICFLLVNLTNVFKNQMSRMVESIDALNIKVAEVVRDHDWLRKDTKEDINELKERLNKLEGK